MYSLQEKTFLNVNSTTKLIKSMLYYLSMKKNVTFLFTQIKKKI